MPAVPPWGSRHRPPRASGDIHPIVANVALPIMVVPLTSADARALVSKPATSSILVRIRFPSVLATVRVLCGNVGEGLKIAMSAVQLRPWPLVISATCTANCSFTSALVARHVVEEIEGATPPGSSSADHPGLDGSSRAGVFAQARVTSAFTTITSAGSPHPSLCVAHRRERVMLVSTRWLAVLP
jgi:hypothetical protein